MLFKRCFVVSTVLGHEECPEQNDFCQRTGNSVPPTVHSACFERQQWLHPVKRLPDGVFPYIAIPKERVQVHARSAVTPWKACGGQLCRLSFLQCSLKRVESGRMTLSLLGRRKTLPRKVYFAGSKPYQCKSSLWDWFAYKQGFKRPFDCCFK